MVVLSEQLRLRGHNVTAICPPGGWISRQLAQANVPTLEWPMHGWRAPATVLRLRTFIHEHAIDLVHTHLTRAAYMGYMAGALAHVPVVSSIHTLTRDWAYRCLPCRNHWFVTVSRDLAEMMIRRGAHPDRVRVIYNGTNMVATPDDHHERLRAVRSALGISEDALVIGVFSRVDEFKGQHILVQAASAIAQSCPTVQFLFVGHAPAAQQERLMEIARRDGLQDRLHFTGIRDDVAELMDATDIVALTSVTEACSMAIIEAMTMAKPVIATRAGGNPELVKDGETGLLVDRKPSDVSRAVVALGRDAELRRRMGVAGRQRAREHFTADRMAADVEEYYREIMRKAPVRPPRTGA